MFSISVEAGPDPLSGGICDRTAQVRDAIVGLIPGVNNCSAVTDAHLAAVAGLLNLKDTGISSLQSSDFSGLTSLQRLFLNKNRLTTLPAGIFSSLVSLRSLLLNNNELTTLPVGIFSGLVSLETLRLQTNELQSLPSNVFAGLVKLNILDLEFNNLTTLPDGLFSGLNLRFLGLEGNQLHTLRAGMFDALSGNLILDLSHNALTTLEDGVFAGLTNLVWLDLANNQLQTLPAGVFAGLTIMNALHLEQNPGADFTFTMTLERVPDTNKVVVVVPQGAPFDMTTTISAIGGMLPTGVSTVTVPVGRTRSEEIAITPLAGATVSLGAAPPLPPIAAFGGIKTGVANPLTVAGARALSMEDAQAPELSVDDAQVNEGPGATLAFVVTMSRTSGATVRVDYATSDGTAVAGSDYTAASGTLTFAAGETEKTVTVAVLDDSHDEGYETLTLTLSNATGAHIEDAEATGAINNNDPMPQAWLARFGRTVASHVTDAIGERLKGGSGTKMVLGGQNLAFGDSSGRETLESRLAEEFLRKRDESLLRGEDTPSSLVRETSIPELLPASSFHLASAGDPESGARWYIWGRGARSSFDGVEEDLTLKGDVTTATLGFDFARERWLLGVALSRSTGDGSFRMAGTCNSGCAVEVESVLTGFYPYARYKVSDKLSLWGVLGHGQGNLTLTPSGMQPIETDIEMNMAAAGVRGVVLPASEQGGFELALRTDLLVTSTSSNAATNLVETEAETSRIRLLLEGSRAFRLGEEAVLTPSVEWGLRYDGGDAETGGGLEVGGSVRYASGRFAVELSARGLLAHGASDYEEWGVSGSVRLAPGEGGRDSRCVWAPPGGLLRAVRSVCGRRPAGRSHGELRPRRATGRRSGLRAGRPARPADALYGLFSLGKRSYPPSSVEFDLARGGALVARPRLRLGTGGEPYRIYRR